MLVMNTNLPYIYRVNEVLFTVFVIDVVVWQTPRTELFVLLYIVMHRYFVCAGSRSRRKL